jgi:hypothetical protein
MARVWDGAEIASGRGVWVAPEGPVEAVARFAVRRDLGNHQLGESMRQ